MWGQLSYVVLGLNIGSNILSAALMGNSGQDSVVGAGKHALLT